MLYIYISATTPKLLQAFEVCATDAFAIPPGASAIAEPDWQSMCTAAGGEEALIEELQVIDMRDGGAE